MSVLVDAWLLLSVLFIQCLPSTTGSIPRPGPKGWNICDIHPSVLVDLYSPCMSYWIPEVHNKLMAIFGSMTEASNKTESQFVEDMCKTSLPTIRNMKKMVVNFAPAQLKDRTFRAIEVCINASVAVSVLLNEQQEQSGTSE